MAVRGLPLVPASVVADPAFISELLAVSLFLATSSGNWKLSSNARMIGTDGSQARRSGTMAM